MSEGCGVALELLPLTSRAQNRDPWGQGLKAPGTFLARTLGSSD